MAEGPDSRCLSPDEIKNCAEMSEALKSSSQESIPGPSVDKEVALNVVYRSYRKWKVQAPVEQVGEDNASKGPSRVEPAAEQPEEEKPKKHNKLWRLCMYVKNEIKTWRCRESKVSEDDLTKTLKKIDTFNLMRLVAEYEMEIKQHIIRSENNNGEWAEVSTSILDEFAACLAKVTKDTYQNQMSPSAEEKLNYFSYEY